MKDKNNTLSDECEANQIPYPDSAEKQFQIKTILEKAYPVNEKKPEPIFLRLQRLYHERPSLNIVFYHAEGPLLISIMLFLAVLIVSFMGESDSRKEEFLLLSCFPILFCSFSFFSIWLEEQEGVVKIIQSCQYTMNYIICLRMFYCSLLSVLIDGGLYLVFAQKIKLPISLAMIGFSALFLFALISLFLYEQFGMYYSNLVLLITWLVVCQLLRQQKEYADFISNMLFEVIPVGIHLVVCVTIVFLFFVYVVYLLKKSTQQTIPLKIGG